MKKFNKDKYLKQLKFKRAWRKYERCFYIGVPCLMIVILGIYFTYSKFSSSKEEEVVRTTVGEFIHGDVVIGAYIDGEYSKTIPGKNDGYVVKNVVCDNGAVGEWDNDKWGLLTTNITKRSKCNVYFKKYTNAEFIALTASNDSANFASDDPDSNIRYIGANPNNYVYFNCNDYSNQSDSTCEKWRIIGVFNNITKSDGTKENLVKIIKDESIGNIAWDSNNVNDWSTATLQQNLNSGTYYTTTLKNDATRNGIENVVWNLGGTDAYNTSTASMFYTAERGTTVYSGRPTTWTGKIGLMYPSDYGYATSGGSTTNRSTCLSTVLYNWKNTDVSDCKDNNYLYKSSYVQWLLNTSGVNISNIFNIDIKGKVGTTAVFPNTHGNFNLNYEEMLTPASTTVNVRPALYLKSDISVKSGNGTSSTPYQLNL